MLEFSNMTTSITTTRRPGRPEKPVTWPSGEFTINDVKKTVKLSRVSLQLKIKKAIENQEIRPVGTDKGEKKMGRPSVVYKLTKTASVVSIPAVDKPGFLIPSADTVTTVPEDDDSPL